MRPILLAAATLAACLGSAADTSAAPANDVSAATSAPEPAPRPAPAEDAAVPPAAPVKVEADHVGRWLGVEGTYLNVTRRSSGGVDLEMQYDPDNERTYQGSVTAEGVRFMRDGVAETAVATDGDATGLKHLAGRKDRLTVKPGEGYCRG